MLYFNLHKSFYDDCLETRVGIIYIFLLENVYYNRELPQKPEIWIHIDGKSRQDQPLYNIILLQFISASRELPVTGHDAANRQIN